MPDSAHIMSVAEGLCVIRGILSEARRTLRLPPVPHEAQIPTADQCGGISAEGDDCCSQRGCFPGFGRHATLTVKRDTNLTVARASGTPVSGLHHQSEPLTLVRGDASVARDRARLQRLPEPLDRFDPPQQVVVEGQQDGYGPGVGAPLHVQKRNGAIRAQDAIAPLLCFGLRRQIKRNGPRQGRPEIGRLADKYGARIGVR